jgi:hypothetical protein
MVLEASLNPLHNSVLFRDLRVDGLLVPRPKVLLGEEPYSLIHEIRVDSRDDLLLCFETPFFSVLSSPALNGYLVPGVALNAPSFAQDDIPFWQKVAI